MKSLCIIIAFLTIFINSNAQKVTDTIIGIKYSSFGRKGGFTLTTNRDSIFYNISSRVDRGKWESVDKHIKMNADDWRGLINEVKRIDLNSIDTAFAPSNSRDLDGSSFNRIHIYTKNTEYQTKDFDYSRPMPIVKSLYDKITDLMLNVSIYGKKIQ